MSRPTRFGFSATRCDEEIEYVDDTPVCQGTGTVYDLSGPEEDAAPKWLRLALEILTSGYAAGLGLGCIVGIVGTVVWYHLVG